MTRRTPDFLVQRIVVALDSSSMNASAMESAIHLAEQLQTEVLALLVQDSDLLRLSELPSAIEVRASDASLRPLNSAGLQRALRVQAERTRQTLQRAAARARVRCVCETVQGKVAHQGQRVGDTDLLIVGLSRHLAFRLAKAKLASGWPLLVFFDGSEASWRALAAAVWLCQKGNSHILVHGGAEGLDLETFRQEVPPFLREAEVPASFQFSPSPTASEMIRAARRAKAVPVLGRRQEFMNPGFLSRILEVVEFAVVAP